MTDQFDLTTEWDVDAPLAAVWTTLWAVEEWPVWWRSVRRVEPLAEGDQDGIGAIHRVTWQTALPYRLTLTTEVINMQPESRMEVRAWGDVEGTGVWTLSSTTGGTTRVRYVWRVHVNKPWMRWLLPILKPVFAWNHREVMRMGGAGIERHLAGRTATAPIET